jgi:hypothetical protein
MAVPAERPKYASGIVGPVADPKVETFREARFAVKHHRLATGNQVSNSVGVECFQQVAEMKVRTHDS